MSELPLNIPPTEDPSLKLRQARNRYLDAVTAYENSDTDETGLLGKELFAARSGLEAAEREACAKVRGIL